MPDEIIGDITTNGVTVKPHKIRKNELQRNFRFWNEVIESNAIGEETNSQALLKMRIRLLLTKLLRRFSNVDVRVALPIRPRGGAALNREFMVSLLEGDFTYSNEYSLESLNKYLEEVYPYQTNIPMPDEIIGDITTNGVTVKPHKIRKNELQRNFRFWNEVIESNAIGEETNSHCTGRFYYKDGTAKNRAIVLAGSIPLHWPVPLSSENHPPMLNKENYVLWSSCILRYAKSRPNEKLIYNSIIGPYIRRMIPELGDQNREVPVNETFHEQTDDELTEKELKQVDADDQAIQTILLSLPEDIYAATDDELTEKELKQVDADDQAIQTILLSLPEDIYAAVDSCKTA
nr:hypothetical protein [Tanacetum cinerariifolium]